MRENKTDRCVLFMHSAKSPCDLGSLGDKLLHKKYRTEDLREDVQNFRRPTSTEDLLSKAFRDFKVLDL